MKISKIPFSYYGSYLSIIEENNELYLRSLHGKSKKCMNSMKIIPLFNNQEIPYTIQASFNEIILHIQNEVAKICFVDQNKILIQSFHKAISFTIDTLPIFNYEYNYFFENDEQPYCIVNSYKNLTKYLVYPQVGNITLQQDIKISTIGSVATSENESQILLTPNSEFVSFIIEDIQTNMAIPSKTTVKYETCLQNSIQNFESFFDAFAIPMDTYYKKAKEAAYILWSNTVSAQGYLKRDSIYASSHHFPGVWSWDNAFASLALSGIHNNLALSNIECVFDYQDKQGQIPGSISDSTIRWNFSKPPVHGYFFLKMFKKQTFSKEDLLKIEKWLVKLNQFYFTYKDCNQDGICEYHHGNDSGQDNSTVFKSLSIVDSPDLSAFLIRNYDCLSEVANLLNDSKKANMYKKKADALMENFLGYFIEDNIAVARDTFTTKVVGKKALLPHIALILSDRLPKVVQESIIQKLKNDFTTSWGIASEEINSEDYISDAYWRGPIWGPSSLLLIESLKECGEHAFANSLIEKWKALIMKSGFNENFDAVSGEGLRDCSFSWTASTFLYYLNN